VRAALIPPKGWFRTAYRSDIHLVLAQIEDIDYQNTYLRDEVETDFVIVDNGAAEGNMVEDHKLFTRANYYAANEIVLPDVMGSADLTLKRAVKFFADNKEVISKEHRFMGVVQASHTMEQACRCIKTFASMPLVKTIGIPRHLVDRTDYARFQICQWLEAQSDLKDRFEVHLLGTNSKFPLEIRLIAQAFPWIRSCDSSMPYNYAIAGKELKPDVQGINRPMNYFDRRPDNLDSNLLDQNIETYTRWASGESTGS
jgi:hypothetical protein